MASSTDESMLADLADPPLPAATRTTIRWQCLLHSANRWSGEVWVDYGASETTVLEHRWEAWQQDNEMPPFLFDHGLWDHEIDFSVMTQTSMDTGSAQPIRRITIMAS